MIKGDIDNDHVASFVCDNCQYFHSFHVFRALVGSISSLKNSCCSYTRCLTLDVCFKKIRSPRANITSLTIIDLDSDRCLSRAWPVAFFVENRFVYCESSVFLTDCRNQLCLAGCIVLLFDVFLFFRLTEKTLHLFFPFFFPSFIRSAATFLSFSFMVFSLR